MKRELSLPALFELSSMRQAALLKGNTLHLGERRGRKAYVVEERKEREKMEHSEERAKRHSVNKLTLWRAG